MPEKASQKTGSAFVFKVTLVDSKPPIWRRVQVPGGLSLHSFHLIIQAAMGWTNGRPYFFRIGETDYRLPNEDEDEGFEEFEHSKKKRLREVVTGPKMVFHYTYDLEDDWNHEILVEKTGLPSRPYPECLGGEGACPLEDCGGIMGYQEILEVLKDKKHPKYAEIRKWVREGFDPAAFDLSEKNESVRDFKVMEMDLGL